MSTYFNKTGLSVNDGDDALGSDLNNLLNETDAGFEQVEQDFVNVSGNITEWGNEDAYVPVEPGLYSSKHFAQIALDWAIGTPTDNTGTATGDLSAKDHAIASAASAALTAADVVSTNADVVQTGLDAAATAADVVSTNADVVLTNADVVSTNADATQTALDVIATGADVTSTNADVVSTNADAIATAADVVSTNADAAQTALDVIATGEDLADVEAIQLEVQHVNNYVTAANPTSPYTPDVETYDTVYLSGCVGDKTIDVEDIENGRTVSIWVGSIANVTVTLDGGTKTVFWADGLTPPAALGVQMIVVTGLGGHLYATYAQDFA